MVKYKLVANNYTGTPTTVIDLENGWCIPFDLANVDFQQYQLWLSEGNTPELAEVNNAV
jgi:hypothetical protein